MSARAKQTVVNISRTDLGRPVANLASGLLKKVNVDARKLLMPRPEATQTIRPQTVVVVPPPVDPLLSIIVPVYNVEEYLASCLDSLMNQTYRSIEVIVVDDGSPDNSYEIAAEYAVKHDRIRVIRRENGGLGAARNTGIAHANGEFITFVDSDDTIPLTAYESMMSATRKSNSDVVVGALVRQRGNKEIRPEWVQRLHSVDRLGITIGEFPEILRDFYSPNKIYRKSFWNEHNFGFREGVLFEDQPVITQALSLASKIDVLACTTYRWLIRDDGSSLSQNMYTAEKIAARRAAIGLTKKFLTQQGDAGVYRAWQETLVEYHFPAYLNQSRKITDEAYAVIIDMIRDVTSSTELADMDGVMPQNKAICYLALEDTRAVVEQAFVGGIRDLRRHAIDETAEGFFLNIDFPAESTCSVPAGYLRLPASSRSLTAHCHRVVWTSNATLEIQGWSTVSGIDPNHSIAERWVEVRDVSSGSSVRVPVTAVQIYQAGIDARTKRIDLSHTGFEASIDLKALIEGGRTDEGFVGKWQILVGSTLRNGEQFIEPLSTRTGQGSAGKLRTNQISDRTIFRQSWSQGDGLTITAERRAIVANAIFAGGQDLSIDLLPTQEFTPAKLVLVNDVDESTTTYDLSLNEAGRWQAEFDSMGNGSYSMYLMDAAKRRRKLHMADCGGTEETSNSFGLSRNTLGALHLKAGVDQALVFDLDVSGDRILLTGTCTSDTESTTFLQLRSAKCSTMVVSPQPLGSSLVWDISLLQESTYGVERGLEKGWYDFVFFRVSPEGRMLPVDAKISNEVMNRAPMRVDQSLTQGKVAIRGNRLSLHVLEGSPLEDRSEWARNRNRNVAINDVPLEDAFFFQCLIGDAANDSQLAIHKYLHQNFPSIKLYWGVTGSSVALPEGAIPRYVRSAAWYKAIHASKYVCVNHELPVTYVKQPGQKVIQTYHGHPFKIMGKPRWESQGVSNEEIQRNLQARSQWDYLLAPSPTAAGLYEDAFPISTRILQVGHPRNDDLARINEGGRQAVRSSLGIREDQIAVLYAPTWRDYESTNPWVSKMTNLLNPYELATLLGPKYKILWRGHPAHQRYGTTVAAHGSIINVTDHPQINDLIVASDVGVFDYSSIRFDYSVTRKPMIFFVPDEDVYFEHTPPLIDYAETAPGPSVHSNKELYRSIVDIEEVKEAYGEQYDAFVTRFNPLDDGDSAMRLVKILFSK